MPNDNPIQGSIEQVSSSQNIAEFIGKMKENSTV